MLFGSTLVCVGVSRKGKRWQIQGSSEEWHGRHLQWAAPGTGDPRRAALFAAVLLKQVHFVWRGEEV